MAHGSPLDEDAYLLGPADVVAILPQLRTQLTFFGHTHVQGGFVATPTGVREIDPACPLESRPEDGPCLVNPGSVGQPRDGDPRAAYALYNAEAGVVSYCRVEYDVESAQRKIRDGGLPPFLAERLSVGR